MRLTRREVIEGAAAGLAAAYLGLPKALFLDDDQNVIAVKTISNRLLRFRIVESEYEDWDGKKQVRWSLEQVT